METAKEKLLQIVLVGQPELGKLLDREDLRQLKQRVALRHHVAPLAWEEVGEYIDHRLQVAGSDGRIKWSDGSLLLIRRWTRGVPRLINVVCDKALLAGYVNDSMLIDTGLVQRAIEDIEGKLPVEASLS